MKNIFKIVSFVLIVSGTMNAQQTPASAQSESILIIGVTAHLGNGQVIENAAIGFDQGKITFVGTQSEADTGLFSKTINADGKHVYPGFIASNTTNGLQEIDAVRATNDKDEVGEMIPHIRTLIAYNAESKVTESLRPNGVLMGQITPRGGTISGTSSVVQFDAWNWEDAAIKVDDGIHLNWPNNFKTKYRGFGNQIISDPNKDYDKKIAEIKTYLLQAKTYSLSKSKEKNLPFNATKGIFDGSQKLYIHANKEKEIIDAIELTKNLGIKNVVLVSGREAYKVGNLLKTNHVSVLLNRVHELPQSEDDDYDLPFKTASILVNQGVLVGLQNQGGMERMNSRNLPFYAGTVAANGLDFEKALQLITLNTAIILGIDKKYGSLEVGKSATLFISEGNALDMRTNNISRAFIDGRDISLETHQTKLWKKYMDKYSSQN